MTLHRPAPTLPETALPAQPGFQLARGVTRLLISLGHAVLCEFVPAPGLRVDAISVGPKGEIWIIECKSCAADFRADRKWQAYLPYCDRFFWAVDCDFPEHLLPEESGLILADPYGAEIMRDAPPSPLAAARRNKLTRDIARAAALRLAIMRDPQIAAHEL
ncbi:MAG: MmcB family DNA repair protein [Paracoccus sp. (in: a-proteobacteria)]|nr:MmcB family DNA repair protein [Paracoccus sp. (in: a-proteobacteria)]